MNAGNYADVISVLQNLMGYKDSNDRIEECSKRNIILIFGEEIWQIKNAEVGDIFKFGSYEQDNDTSNGKEDIEWLVLEVKDGKALLISKYALIIHSPKRLGLYHRRHSFNNGLAPWQKSLA